MPTPHIESNKQDIADVVIMPGDPLRAKYIAERFLTNYKLVNKVRNMFAFTGYYKNKRVTVMGSGMGIPSIGIYAYELFKFYDVKKIIRVGSCGSYKEDVKLLDVILASSSYSKSTFNYLFSGDNQREMYASMNLNDAIIKTAQKRNMDIKVGKIITSDVFDPYVENKKELMDNYPKDDFLGSEMESFGLFYLANLLGTEAACLLTVSDSLFDGRKLNSDERQTAFDDMITLALESLI